MLNPNSKSAESLREKITWAVNLGGVTRLQLQAACGLKSPSGVTEWLRTGRIDKKHLPTIARLTGTRLEWWLDAEAQVPPTDGWRTHTGLEIGGRGTVVRFSRRSAAAPPSSNVEPARADRSVPLISWVTAGGLSDIEDTFHPGDADEWITARTSSPSERAFALRVVGDSMTNSHSQPSFPEGTIIIVDPDRAPKAGDYVVAKDVETQGATFKRLTTDGAQWVLQPLNPQWPTKVIDDPGLRVIGVAIEFMIVGRL